MKTVFITGVSSGIGFELATAYLKTQTHNVIGCDLSPCSIEHPNFTYYKLDVSDLDAYKKIVDNITRPDIWINNAGLAKLGGIEAIRFEDAAKVIDVNCTAVIYGTQLAIQKMSSPSHGHIVNVSSLNGLIPTPFNSVYAASKHAVVGFTRSIQEELKLRKNPIRVSLVLPGFVKTKIMESHQDIRFPKWLDWAVTSPTQAALEIIDGLNNNQAEIICGMNGKAIKTFFKYFPKSTVNSARLLLSKNWREAVGLDKIER
ncbi:MAG: SDR family NAD(P)-dependent oxidoreductase [Bdellovibrionales bacterium]|nr:SDR family NAD(P)-dependent oxidoreductase [Bdellovibrionales bacterium]